MSSQEATRRFAETQTVCTKILAKERDHFASHLRRDLGGGPDTCVNRENVRQIGIAEISDHP